MESKVLLQKDLMHCINNFSIRCLYKSTKWASELLTSISKEDSQSSLAPYNPQELPVYEYSILMTAISLFNLGEYKKASYCTKNYKSPITAFLHYYCEYMELQKLEWEENSKNFESSFVSRPAIDGQYLMLVESLRVSEFQDSYILYLQAIIYKRLKNTELCLDLLFKAIFSEYINWPAWLELAYITASDEVDEYLNKLPKIWMKDFYLIEIEKRFDITKLSKLQWDNFQQIGITESPYFKSFSALKLKTLHLVDHAHKSFEELYKTDPYNIDSIDTYSNILYLQNDYVSLSKLVKHCIKFAKYKPKTCFAVGNLYNLACEHTESALYFQQAVILDPNYTDAWTLLGHQFIEIKNISSAFGCYKKAIEIDRFEYRAWFGLGQLYELLNMSHQSLSLYKKAYFLRPSDSKLSLAVSRLLESLGYLEECIDMLTVSIENGDQEGGSTFKLAGLLETRDKEKSALLYKQFLIRYDDKGMAKADDSSTATIFLMDYYFERKQFEEAEIYARRGCRYNQSLKHSQMVLERINDTISSMGDKSTYRPRIPTRPTLFTKGKDKEIESDMDMGTSP